VDNTIVFHMQAGYRSNGKSNLYTYKQSIGVTGETKVLFATLSRGERYIASRFRVGRFGEIDLVTLTESGIIHCYEVRTIGPRSGNRYLSDQYTQKKIRKVQICARLFEMYHVKRFIGIGTGLYIHKDDKFILKYTESPFVRPILVSVTSETVGDRKLAWNIRYFDLSGDLLSEEDKKSLV
jgi:Holliday junction resolvase-like predicted endonuclease